MSFNQLTGLYEEQTFVNSPPIIDNINSDILNANSINVKSGTVNELISSQTKVAKLISNIVEATVLTANYINQDESKLIVKGETTFENAIFKKNNFSGDLNVENLKSNNISTQSVSTSLISVSNINEDKILIGKNKQIVSSDLSINDLKNNLENVTQLKQKIDNGNFNYISSEFLNSSSLQENKILLSDSNKNIVSSTLSLEELREDLNNKIRNDYLSFVEPRLALIEPRLIEAETKINILEGNELEDDGTVTNLSTTLTSVRNDVNSFKSDLQGFDTNISSKAEKNNTVLSGNVNINTEENNTSITNIGYRSQSGTSTNNVNLYGKTIKTHSSDNLFLFSSDRSQYNSNRNMITGRISLEINTSDVTNSTLPQTIYIGSNNIKLTETNIRGNLILGTSVKPTTAEQDETLTINSPNIKFPKLTANKILSLDSTNNLITSSFSVLDLQNLSTSLTLLNTDVTNLQNDNTLNKNNIITLQSDNALNKVNIATVQQTIQTSLTNKIDNNGTININTLAGNTNSTSIGVSTGGATNLNSATTNINGRVFMNSSLGVQGSISTNSSITAYGLDTTGLGGIVRTSNLTANGAININTNNVDPVKNILNIGSNDAIVTNTNIKGNLTLGSVTSTGVETITINSPNVKLPKLTANKILSTDSTNNLISSSLSVSDILSISSSLISTVADVEYLKTENTKNTGSINAIQTVVNNLKQSLDTKVNNNPTFTGTVTSNQLNTTNVQVSLPNTGKVTMTAGNVDGLPGAVNFLKSTDERYGYLGWGRNMNNKNYLTMVAEAYYVGWMNSSEFVSMGNIQGGPNAIFTSLGSDNNNNINSLNGTFSLTGTSTTLISNLVHNALYLVVIRTTGGPDGTHLMGFIDIFKRQYYNLVSNNIELTPYYDIVGGKIYTRVMANSLNSTTYPIAYNFIRLL